MKTKTKFHLSAISALLTAVLIVLVRSVDAAPIGPAGTSIGLSHLNQAVSNATGVHMLWYDITDIFGIAAIFIVALFAALGAVQLFRRKSLLKVDREILLLGGLYFVIFGLYALFEVVIVNYRPIIMPDNTVPEASFPSSHTMLICVVMGSTMMMLGRYIGKYIKGKNLRTVLQAICAAVLAVTVIGRLICGVHWFTDIMGGILISAALLALFSGLLDQIGSGPVKKTDEK